jgi:hypothetical protein
MDVQSEQLWPRHSDGCGAASGESDGPADTDVGGGVRVRVRYDVEWSEEEDGEEDGDGACLYVCSMVGRAGSRRR